jgi:hypothetical protein
VIGANGGHFWIQHPRKYKVYQKYSMQLKKKIIFADLCNQTQHHKNTEKLLQDISSLHPTVASFILLHIILSQILSFQCDG